MGALGGCGFLSLAVVTMFPWEPKVQFHLFSHLFSAVFQTSGSIAQVSLSASCLHRTNQLWVFPPSVTRCYAPVSTDGNGLFLCSGFWGAASPLKTGIKPAALQMIDNMLGVIFQIRFSGMMLMALLNIVTTTSPWVKQKQAVKHNSTLFTGWTKFKYFVTLL